jgi:hypothetical protein
MAQSSSRFPPKPPFDDYPLPWRGAYGGILAANRACLSVDCYENDFIPYAVGAYDRACRVIGQLLHGDALETPSPRYTDLNAALDALRERGVKPPKEKA